MTDDKLRELLQRLDSIEQRLDAIEGRTQPARATIVLPRPQAESIPPPAFDLSAPSTPQPLSELPGAKAKPQNAEYEFGAKALPRIGAGVMIIGIGLLISIGIERGYLTPLVQFVLALLTSVGFVIAGQILRNEREDFGSVLTAIGSTGLYLSLAAGHSIHRLYEGEMLVGLFTALSLANLAYGSVRASKTFFMIGMVGGYVGALLPLTQNSAWTTAGALCCLIYGSSTFILLRQKWNLMALPFGVATAFSGFLIAIVASNRDHDFVTLHHENSTVIWAIAYAASVFPFGRLFEPNEHDRIAWPIALAACLAIPISTLMGPETGPIIAVSAVTGAGILAALTMKAIPKQVGLIWNSGLFLVIAPFTFQQPYPGLGAAISATLFLCFSFRFLSGSALVLGSGMLLASLADFCDHQFGTSATSYTTELAMILSAFGIVNGVLVGVAGRMCSRNDQPSIDGSYFVSAVLVGLWVLAIAFDNFHETFTYELTALWTLLGYAALLGVAANVLKRSGLGIASAAFLIATTFAYWTVQEANRLPLSLQAELIASGSMMILALLGVRGMQLEQGQRLQAEVPAAVYGMAMLAHMLWLVLTQSTLQMSANAAVTASATGAAATLLGIGFAIDRIHLRIIALMTFGLTLLKVIMVDLATVDSVLRVVITMVLGLAMLAAGYLYIRNRSRFEPPPDERPIDPSAPPTASQVP